MRDFRDPHFVLSVDEVLLRTIIETFSEIFGEVHGQGVLKFFDIVIHILYATRNILMLRVRNSIGWIAKFVGYELL